MSRLCLVSTLVLVLLVFWTADGLLLTKTRVRRDAYRPGGPRRTVGLGQVRDTLNDAHDHFTDLLHGGQASHHGHRRASNNPSRTRNKPTDLLDGAHASHHGHRRASNNPSRTRNEPVHLRTDTTTPLPTTTSSSTAATTSKTAQKTVFTESTTLITSDQNEISLKPVVLAERLIPRTSHGNNVSNLNDVGVSNLTHSDSEGLKVTIVKEDVASATKIRKQIFTDGIKSQISCNQDDPSQPRLVAGCGDHYLFPGYNVKLLADSLPCTWRFRYTAPDVIILSKGRTSKNHIGLVIQETNVSDSEDANATAHAKERYGLGGLIPRDLVLEQHTNDTNASVVPTEICVPTNPQNSQFNEYDIHEGICCHSTPDTTCGIPNGALNDTNFGMQTFPWEVVLTVTMKPANSDKEDTTYCSGTLISEEWLLTTSACILRPKNKHPTTTPQVGVSFAADTTNNDPVNYGVKEYIVYPTSSETHDITLVRLDRKSPRTPVCLPAYNKGAINEGVFDQPGIVFGWVLPANSTPYMSTRNQQVISSAECIRRLGRALPPHILCTVDRVTEDEPCLADGHLLMGSAQFTLLGLSTPRLECKDDLRQHSSIEHFMPWISSITGIKMRN